MAQQAFRHTGDECEKGWLTRAPRSPVRQERTLQPRKQGLFVGRDTEPGLPGELELQDLAPGGSQGKGYLGEKIIHHDGVGVVVSAGWPV